jgi:hypothetical protein
VIKKSGIYRKDKHKEIGWGTRKEKLWERLKILVCQHIYNRYDAGKTRNTFTMKRQVIERR